MTKYRNVGPERRDEVAPQRARHDMRRKGVKLKETMRTPVGGLLVLLILGVMSFALPAMSDLLFVVGAGAALFIKSSQATYTLPAKMPKHCGLVDPAELNPKGVAQRAAGAFFLGNDRVTMEEVWLTNRDAGVHMLVLGTTGSGKAQPLDAKIRTPYGWRRMGDIKPGDLVSMPAGGSAPVTGVFPQGKLEIFKVTFADGRSTEACADHLWEVHHKHWNGKYRLGVSRVGAAVPRVLRTRDIAALLERNKGTFSVRLPKPVEMPRATLPLDPYLLGLLLGDGNFSGNRLRFSTADAELVEAVEETLPQTLELTQYASDGRYDYEIRYKPEFRECGGRNADGSYATNPVRLALRELGLDGKTSFDKFIPKSFMQASIAQRTLMLRGLMDSDGHACTGGSISFSSSSEQLAKDVQELVRSLGGIAKISTRTTTYSYAGEKRLGALSYLVSIRHPEPDSLFALGRKRERCASYQYADSLKLGIIKIESVGSKPAQCIMVDHSDHLYITDDYVVTHNTEMLLGLCQNALNQGSGFMFVDGKAQDKIAFKIQDLCRARGRDDDVLVLNFMTGARDIIGPQPNKITNTMNPFSYGSSGMISQIVVGLMSSGGGGDDMWKDRAISFVEALSPPLCYLRDHCGLILDVNEFRKYFSLVMLEDLCWKGAEKYPGLDLVLDPLSNYLLNLPGYDKTKYGKRGGQGDDTNLQHGYITMQLVRAFTSLADTYGHIVRVPLGEVYFPDLVKQRRIVIAMLPSLEKTPSETANIGKIIVTALKNIMAEGLGSTLEGSRDDLDNDEGKALLPPYVVILDEYGYYAVKGFAVAFAQARSLGFVCIVGGQDLASFQRESKEEAVSICGNTRLKAFGSIEDPDQTMDFAVKTAGKALVAEASGYEGDVGTFGMSYRDSLNIHLKSLERIDPSDVKEQKEGQFHFVIGSKVIRAQTYYVNPKKVKYVQLNHFLQVPPPTKLQLDQLEMQSTGLASRLATMDLSMISVPTVREIEAAAAVLADELFQRLRPVEQSIAAVVRVGIERDRYLQSFREDVRTNGHGGATELYKRIAESGSESISAVVQRGGASSAVPAPSAAPAASRITRADPDEFDASSFLQSVPNSGDDDDEGFDEEDADLRNAAEAFAQQAQASAAAEARNNEFEDPSQALSAAIAQAPDIDDEDVRTFATVSVFLPPPQSTSFGADVFAEESEVARRVEQALTGPDDATPLLNMQATIDGVASIERQLGASTEEAGAAARMVAKQIEDSTRYPQSIPAQKTTDQITGMLGELVGLLEGE